MSGAKESREIIYLGPGSEPKKTPADEILSSSWYQSTLDRLGAVIPKEVAAYFGSDKDLAVAEAFLAGAEEVSVQRSLGNYRQAQEISDIISELQVSTSPFQAAAARAEHTMRMEKFREFAIQSGSNPDEIMAALIAASNETDWECHGIFTITDKGQELANTFSGQKARRKLIDL